MSIASFGIIFIFVYNKPKKILKILFFIKVLRGVPV